MLTALQRCTAAFSVFFFVGSRKSLIFRVLKENKTDMKVREFIDNLTYVTDIVKNDLKETWEDELDDELNMENWDGIWEMVKETVYEEFEENCPEDEE